MKTTVAAALLGSIALCSGAAAARAAAQTQADHPTRLQLASPALQPPRAADFRTELANGLVLYLATDNRFPLVSIRAMVRAGSLYDPPDKVGITRLAARFLPQAATDAHSAAEIGTLLGRYGGELTASSSDVALTLDLSLHAEGAQEAVSLISALLRSPRFRADAIARDQKLTAETVSGPARPELDVRTQFTRILYGEHPLARAPTPGLLAKTSAEDLQEHHARVVRPQNVVLMVSGDFDRTQMLGWWRQHLDSWAVPRPELPPIPTEITGAPERKIVLVHRPGLKQAFGHIGHAGIRMGEPDYFAVQVMNWILTGSKVYAGIGAFSARLWFQLRTNRGISSMGYGEFWDTFHYPPPFVLYWKGREEKTGEAVTVIMREIEKIRSEPVSAHELETAKRFYIHGLPARFRTAEETVRTLGQLEFDRAPLDYYEKFPEAIRQVTEADVLRAARRYLRPDRLLTVIVGDADRILAHGAAAGIRLDEIAPVQVIRESQRRPSE